ncbi:MAG: adenosylcobinamide-GDP ribazoletransferase [Spirochaetales bacterium]|uniref:Adenosylcobinamide-GDP ribazoletransferase n=1 Tax=Candidatus Thalassospirochaeta sargassi TaxID=3119039 RepID=A0AAJ1IEG6_9SPIO|nr:adenosylcobinamide-GDP ribazoletransferase [Spirochaetales bacterium]
MKKLLNAFRFLTIIPIPGAEHADLSEAGKSAAFFPIVGLVIGFLCAIVFRAAGLLWSAPVAAAATVVCWVLLTAGLHIDGLADLADGIGGGWDVESRLRIMKDSAIGTYGALSVVILLLLKTVFIYELASSAGFWPAFAVILFIPSGARLAQVLSIRVFAPAKKEGFGAAFKNGVGTGDTVSAGLIAGLSAAVLWGPYGLIVPAVGCVFALMSGWWVSRRLGGLNGDSYGAICELSELFLLILLNILSPVPAPWIQTVAGMLQGG